MQEESEMVGMCLGNTAYVWIFYVSGIKILRPDVDMSEISCTIVSSQGACLYMISFALTWVVEE